MQRWLRKPVSFFFLSLNALQGFFKDLMTVNNPHVSPQRIEEYVNAAVGNHGNTEGLGNKGSRMFPVKEVMANLLTYKLKEILTS